jgi:thioredoxin 1
MIGKQRLMLDTCADDAVGCQPSTMFGQHILGGGMSTICEIDQSKFSAQVLESDQPVLVDFSAGWCSPCKMMEPIIEELAQEWNGLIKVVKVDVDHNPDLAMQYQVMGLPTFILFVDGESKERFTGYQPKDKIQKKLRAVLSEE